jgi:hypothetical protein
MFLQKIKKKPLIIFIITTIILAIGLSIFFCASDPSFKNKDIIKKLEKTEVSSEEDFHYIVDDFNNVIIDNYLGSDEYVVIPEILGGKPVVEIADSTFIGNPNLSAVKIPEGVVSIGACAFMSCESLKFIELPTTLKIINSGAFQFCKNLTFIELPENLITIGGSAFKDCESLSDIEIPQTVERINSNIFNGTAITHLNLPENVTYIGDEAFANCSNLKSITIYDKVDIFGENIFKDSPKVKIKVVETDISKAYFENSNLNYSFK